MDWGFWYKVAFTSVVVLGSLLIISSVNKPREPLTGGIVAATVFIQGLIIWGLWALL